MMIDTFESLQEMFRLYQRKDEKFYTKESGLFRVRTGLKCGDWYDEMHQWCNDTCGKSGGFIVEDPTCQCN